MAASAPNRRLIGGQAALSCIQDLNTRSAWFGITLLVLMWSHVPTFENAFIFYTFGALLAFNWRPFGGQNIYWTQYEH